MIRHTITVKNKTFPYFLEPKTGDEGEAIYHVRCPGANINQGILREDLGDFLLDLPTWIIDRQEEKAKEKDTVLRFRVRPAQKKAIEKKAYKKGFKNVSDYLRSLALHG